MNRAVILPIETAKCIASACKQAKPCARRDVPMVKGRRLADFSQPYNYMAECGPANGWVKFIPLDKAVAPTVKPAPKEWIGR